MDEGLGSVALGVWCLGEFHGFLSWVVLIAYSVANLGSLGWSDVRIPRQHDAKVAFHERKSRQQLHDAQRLAKRCEHLLPSLPPTPQAPNLTLNPQLPRHPLAPSRLSRRLSKPCF